MKEEIVRENEKNSDLTSNGPVSESEGSRSGHSKTLKDLFNDDGIAVFNKEDFYLLPRIRQKYPRVGAQWREIENFLKRYSNIDDNTLTHDAADGWVERDTKPGKNAQNAKLANHSRDFFRTFNGDPIQSFLYNAVIYNMEVESWFSKNAKSVKEIVSELCQAISCLYINQWRLNICIGRTAYVKDEVDFELMYCICSEMVSRFPFINEMILEGGKQIYKRDAKIQQLVESSLNLDDNGRYFKAFTGSIFISHIYPKVSSRSSINFTKTENKFQSEALRLMKTNRDNPISSPSGFWKSISGVNLRDSGNFLVKEGGAVPTKDDIYVLSIACGFNFNQFSALINAATSDICDRSVYSTNDYNSRDEIIESCIRDNDTPYIKRFADDLQLANGNAVPEEPRKDRFLPIKALIRADRILYDNIKHYIKTPDDFLLYHNYMMNRRKCQKYIEMFKEWKKIPDNKEKSAVEFEYTYLQSRENDKSDPLNVKSASN